VEFDQSLSMAELANIIDDTETRIRAAVPSARRIFVEPDVVRPGKGLVGDPWQGLDP
jgi:divalent metal cation (Fe/Co/Zn/Cd) transporter